MGNQQSSPIKPIEQIFYNPIRPFMVRPELFNLPDIEKEKKQQEKTRKPPPPLPQRQKTRDTRREEEINVYPIPEPEKPKVEPPKEQPIIYPPIVPQQEILTPPDIKDEYKPNGEIIDLPQVKSGGEDIQPEPPVIPTYQPPDEPIKPPEVPVIPVMPEMPIINPIELPKVEPITTNENTFNNPINLTNTNNLPITVNTPINLNLPEIQQQTQQFLQQQPQNITINITNPAPQQTQPAIPEKSMSELLFGVASGVGNVGQSSIAGLLDTSQKITQTAVDKGFGTIDGTINKTFGTLDGTINKGFGTLDTVVDKGFDTVNEGLDITRQGINTLGDSVKNITSNMNAMTNNLMIMAVIGGGSLLYLSTKK